MPGEDGQHPRFGDYELVELIARGGMGVVYKARHVSLGRTVALKRIAKGELASDAEVHRFIAEARFAASLEHPNIVPIYEVGAHEGDHYFTMPLLEGGSLAGQVRRFRGSPREAASLLETIARAVHYGHQRGVLHRDLKPANLLLDAAGVPHIADFGVAKAFNKGAGVSMSGVVGTPLYMAPEQAWPRGQPLTVAADVYSLGVILYELLTGQPPLKANDLSQQFALLRDAEPLPPSALAPSISRDLETICLKCLEKEPARRYGSAEELADELQRYREGREIQARPRGPLGRVWMWCLRHPLGAGLLATLLWCLSVAAVGAVRIARDQAEDLRRDALRVNLYAARLVAGTVLFELGQYRQGVERAAAQPQLVAALQSRDAAALESFCRHGFTYYDGPRGGLKSSDAGSPFALCFIQDTAGRTIGRWPQPPHAILGKEYGWRDYFQGARRLAAEGRRAAYVSRAFKTESDGKYAFALAAPVYAADGTWLGVLGVTVATDSRLGLLRLNDSSDSDRTVTLVALTDRARGQVELPARDVYAVLAHERLGRGMPATLEPQTARQLARSLPEPSSNGHEQLQLPDFGGRVLEGYRDPVSDEPGTWLAAFAPVGHTAFAVIVQTRENAVLAVNTLLARRIAWWSLPFALGAGLVWLIFGWSRYRSSAQRTE
ncbi:protein kinase domain-containing protein [Archangium sp.]|uniref:protein kinase domain-containing protein n=1 Tax=Archangium sp. TaxID=1872627 RepID=UPI002D431F4D|nr:protein kinase [Archangium sp.]HYO59818.1 protein kinase [Archangium sp.]